VARITYTPVDLDVESVAPSGYCEPVAEEWLAYEGRRLLYVLGNACVDASCCGVGTWGYVRVEGFVVDDAAAGENGLARGVDLDTVERERDRVAIGRMLEEKHPGARIEFR